MVYKRIAAICFAIAFLMAIIMFTGTGSDYIPRSVAKIIFLAAGALGLLLNLLAFRFDKQNVNFNFFYWAGSIVLFFGLTFRIMHWPYSFYIIIAGLLIVGLSFFYNPKIDEDDSAKDDLLDDSI